MNKTTYKRAKYLFEKLGFKTFREWLVFYQDLDVKLLMDIWISFRNTSLKNYGLEPAHHYSAPGLSFDAMLKMTKAEINLITKPDMYQFFELVRKICIFLVNC